MSELDLQPKDYEKVPEPELLNASFDPDIDLISTPDQYDEEAERQIHHYLESLDRVAGDADPESKALELTQLKYKLEKVYERSTQIQARITKLEAEFDHFLKHGDREWVNFWKKQDLERQGMFETFKEELKTKSENSHSAKEIEKLTHYQMNSSEELDSLYKKRNQFLEGHPKEAQFDEMYFGIMLYKGDLNENKRLIMELENKISTLENS